MQAAVKVNDNHVNVILSKRKTGADSNTVGISRHRQLLGMIAVHKKVVKACNKGVI